MPGVTLHFILARASLDDWRAGASPAPFDLADPRLVEAFQHGAIGPDLGYFPGGERLLSELSHYVRTGELTRTLVESARTPVETAFAWGWLTHVLGDCALHPLIGRAVGHETRGSYEVFVDGATDPLTHLRVEVGLDAWYAARAPQEEAVRLGPLFDRHSVRFLERAYARTYGVEIPLDTFLRSHVAVGRRAAQSLATLWLIGSLMGDPARSDPLPGIRHVLRTAYRRSRWRGIALAYLNPLLPTPWLLERVDAAIERYRACFAELCRVGLDGLEDANLDTGRPIAAEVEAGHRPTRNALEALGRAFPTVLPGRLVGA